MASRNSVPSDNAIADLFLLPGRPAQSDVVPLDRPVPPLPAAEIARLIRIGRAPEDRVFDQYLPPDLRAVSSRHWTPLAVIARATEWFRAFSVTTVVDVGSGAGKFCVGGALAGECNFTGVERRPRLVGAARRLAREFDVEGRVRFLNATFGRDRIPLADAYYLFNPFAENAFGESERIDEDVDLGLHRYDHDVEATRHFLRGVPTGTLVLTFHGFGGRLPPGFTVVCVDRSFSGILRMWKKTANRRVKKSAPCVPAL